jgi:hypothetical protein
VIVWFPLSSIANTSNLYRVSSSNISSGTVTSVAVSDRMMLNSMPDSSSSTMT